MQYNRVLKLIMVHLLLMCSIFSFSHPKGHFHKEDGTIFNTWTLKNGTIIKGNFSMGKGEFIVLEQEAGRLLKIPISDFSLQDQLLANLKVKKYVKLTKSSTYLELGLGSGQFASMLFKSEKKIEVTDENIESILNLKTIDCDIYLNGFFQNKKIIS